MGGIKDFFGPINSSAEQFPPFTYSLSPRWRWRWCRLKSQSSCTVRYTVVVHGPELECQVRSSKKGKVSKKAREEGGDCMLERSVKTLSLTKCCYLQILTPKMLHSVYCIRSSGQCRLAATTTGLMSQVFWGRRMYVLCQKESGYRLQLLFLFFLLFCFFFSFILPFFPCSLGIELFRSFNGREKDKGKQ